MGPTHLVAVPDTLPSRACLLAGSRSRRLSDEHLVVPLRPRR